MKTQQQIEALENLFFDVCTTKNTKDGSLKLETIFSDNPKKLWQFILNNFIQKEEEKWISVKDRLPEGGDRVITTNGKYIHCSGYEGGVGFRVDKNHSSGERTFVTYWTDTTHWQPLPEPPKQ